MNTILDAGKREERISRLETHLHEAGVDQANMRERNALYARLLLRCKPYVPEDLREEIDELVLS